jgi:hypothetical protein
MSRMACAGFSLVLVTHLSADYARAEVFTLQQALSTLAYESTSAS